MGYTKDIKESYNENYYQNLLAAPPEYVESGETQAAGQKLADYEMSAPKNENYNGTYQQSINKAVSDYLNKNYNYNADDKLYNEYADVYRQGAEKAEKESAAYGKQLSGGSNTYSDIVSNEVKQNFLSGLGNAYETYREFADTREQADRASKLKEIELLENMDNREYQQNRDKITDYMNFLNYYNSKYDTSRSLDLQNFKNEWEAYNTKLSNSQSGYQFDKSLAETQRQNNETMRYNYDKLAEDQRQFDENTQYNYYQQLLKSQSESEENGTENANALLASIGDKKDFAKKDEYGALSYNDYVNQKVEDYLDKGMITADEATYILTKTGLLKESDDTTFDSQNANAKMVGYGLMDSGGNVQDENSLQLSGDIDYKTYVNSVVQQMLNMGQITKPEATYILTKTGVK